MNAWIFRVCLNSTGYGVDTTQTEVMAFLKNHNCVDLFSANCMKTEYIMNDTNE